MKRELTITISGARMSGKTQLMRRLKQFLEFDGHEVRINDSYLRYHIERQPQKPLEEPVTITFKEENNE